MSKAIKHVEYSSLSREYYDEVSCFVAGQDVFVSLPTGTGKVTLLPCSSRCL